MTSDERRVVAARLRMCGQTVKGTKHIFMYLANCVDTPSDDLDGDDIFCLQRNPTVAKKTLEKLADLIDPTCHDFGGEEGTNGEGYDFACSACGCACDIPEPSYCPNCGARVVTRDGHE